MRMVWTGSRCLPACLDVWSAGLHMDIRSAAACDRWIIRMCQIIQLIPPLQTQHSTRFAIWKEIPRCTLCVYLSVGFFVYLFLCQFVFLWFLFLCLFVYLFVCWWCAISLHCYLTTQNASHRISPVSPYSMSMSTELSHWSISYYIPNESICHPCVLWKINNINK